MDSGLERLGLRVGRVVSVEDHAGARAPSYVLLVDLGGEGTREATLALPSYEKDALLGRQVICAEEAGELVVLTAQSHAQGAVLLRPDADVEDGSAVA